MVTGPPMQSLPFARHNTGADPRISPCGHRTRLTVVALSAHVRPAELEPLSRYQRGVLKGVGHIRGRPRQGQKGRGLSNPASPT